MSDDPTPSPAGAADPSSSFDPAEFEAEVAEFLKTAETKVSPQLTPAFCQKLATAAVTMFRSLLMGIESIKELAFMNLLQAVCDGVQKEGVTFQDIEIFYRTCNLPVWLEAANVGTVAPGAETRYLTDTEKPAPYWLMVHAVPVSYIAKTYAEQGKNYAENFVRLGVTGAQMRIPPQEE